METTLNFIRTLFPSLEPGETIELRSWKRAKNNPKLKTDKETFFSANYDELTQWIVERYQAKEVFIGVNPRSGASGKNENITRACWLWADLDSDKLHRGGKKLENYLHSKIALPPTMIVASHGDNGGLHVYWAIEPTTDIDKWLDLNKSLADHIGADDVQDAPRILRPVGTLNHKYNPPIPVNLWLQHNIIYSLADVEAALKLPSKAVKTIMTGNADEFDGDRSRRDFNVLTQMIRAGYSDDLIRAVFSTSAIGDKYREEGGEHYLSFTLDKLRKTEAPVAASRWGIIEKDGSYWRVMSDGNQVQLSTFTFVPEILLEGDSKKGEEDTLLGTMVADGIRWPEIALSKKAFADNAGMAKSLPKAAWQWLGKDSDVRRLLPYLLDKLKEQSGGVPTKVKTSVLGRHEDLFVLDGQIISQNGLVNYNEAPIVWLPAGKELPSIKFTPAPYEIFKRELDEFIRFGFSINDSDVVLVALGWLVAAFYKPLLEKAGICMPVLNIFGTRGSGKTTLVTDLLQRLSGYVTPRTYDSNTTRFVMLSLLGCSNAIPISFSEFRSASMKDADQLPGYIRLSYDNGHDSRGRSDQSMVDYALLSPIIVDGEDPIGDPACLERMIQLNLRPETIREGSIAYESLQALHNVNLNAIGFELIKYTLNRPLEFDKAYKRMRELYSSNLPDRVRRNFALVLAGLDVLRDFLLLHGYEMQQIDERELLAHAIDNVVNIDTGRTTLPVDEMITDMILFIEHNEGLKQFIFTYTPETMNLGFNFTSVYHWWARSRRAEGKSVLDEKALKRQLKERTFTDDILSQSGGNYVIDKKNANVSGKTHYLHFINLPMARKAGLEIPEMLTRFKPKIVSQLVKEKAKNES